MLNYYDIIESPVGPLFIEVDGAGRLCKLYFGHGSPERYFHAGVQRSDEAVAAVAAQLTEYFAGRRKAFDLELAAEGSDFQKSVWAQLVRIPYGETRSYGQLATALGNPAASRAVGRANATNPISIVVPCHRVIGADGSMTGFGGGVDVKEKLLSLEQGVAVSLFG